MSGNLNEMIIYSKSEGNSHRCPSFIGHKSNENLSKCSKKPNKWGLQGSMRISPKNFDLFYDLPQGNLKVLDGDKFSLHFWSNPTP